jgi:hypothetical protein
MQKNGTPVKLNLVNKDVMEIMGKPLPVLLRWGNVFLITLLLLVAAAAYIVKYPQTTIGSIIIDKGTPAIVFSGRNSVIKAGQQMTIIKKNPGNFKEDKWSVRAVSASYRNKKGMYQVNIDKIPEETLLNETTILKTGSRSYLETIFR